MHKPRIFIAAKLSFTPNDWSGYNVHGGKPGAKGRRFFVWVRFMPRCVFRQYIGSLAAQQAEKSASGFGGRSF